MIEGRPRILAVEDDSEAAEQLVEFLSMSGYQIDLAADGNEGLSRGRSADYAVMRIDRMLPDMDGMAIIRRLRENGVAPPALNSSVLSAKSTIGCVACAPVATIISSSRLPSPNCSPVWRRSPDAALPWSKTPSCVSVI